MRAVVDGVIVIDGECDVAAPREVSIRESIEQPQRSRLHHVVTVEKVARYRVSAGIETACRYGFSQ